MLAGLPFNSVHASVYQASAESVAPQWINPLSRAVAVIGLNLSQNSGERLLSVGVNFTDAGADGAFNASDLAPLAADASSGVALYQDNKTSGSLGSFDQNDTPVQLSPAPQWASGPSGPSTSLSTGGIAIPGNDLGNNTGADFFVVIRTSASPSEGDDFMVSLGPGDVRTDNGPPDFPPAQTPVIVFDTRPPHADSGGDVAVDEGAEMGFSAARSSDNIGIANYTWTFGDFAPDNLRYGVYVTYTFGAPGRYFVLLNVTDYAGNTDEDILLVTVRNLNQPPVITSVPPNWARQGTPYVYLMEASDPDSDALRFGVRDGPLGLSINSTTGLALWVPGSADSGSVLVNLSVTDNRSPPVVQSFRIDVQSVNSAPRFVSLPVLIATQGRDYIYIAEAQDLDNNQLNYSLVAGPRGMTVGVYTGEVRWTPLGNQVGTSRVVISASDREFTVYQNFTIGVSNVNDDPEILSIPPTTAIQGVSWTYKVEATDLDGDELSYFLNGRPLGMTIGTTGLVTWTPGPDQVGWNLVNVEVKDSHGGSVSQPFSVTVTNVNDPPRIESAPPATARQGAPFSYWVQVFDADGDRVRLSLLSPPPGMTINSSSGLIEWVPGQESVGRVSVTVLAEDGHGGIAYQTFELSVQDVNDPPVFVGELPPVAYQDQPYLALVRALDPDGDELTFTLVSQLEDISLDRRTGTLVWIPRIPQNQTIAVRVTDQNGTNADDYFNVTVRPSPQPPAVTPIGLLRARAGRPFSFRVVATDRAGGTLTFTSLTRLVRINTTTGLATCSPVDGDVGAHEFSVDVRNQAGLNTTVTGVLVVEAAEGGLSLSRVAGFGLAGLAGADPRLILAITLVMGGILFYQYARLRRREAAETPAAADGPAAPVQGGPVSGVTEEERAALRSRQDAAAGPDKTSAREALTRERAAEAPADTERLERKARDWDAALSEQRAAREFREKEEAERRERELSEKRERELGQAADKEQKSRDLKEREEAERRIVLQRIEAERKVLSTEEQERLEREVERELAASGLGDLDEGTGPHTSVRPPPGTPDGQAAAPGKKVAPKRARRGL